MIDRRNFARLVSLTAAAVSIGAKPGRAVVKPKRLAEGDTVGLVLPASATLESDDISLAQEQLEAIGLKVRIGAHAYDRHGYFAGRDRDRARACCRISTTTSSRGSRRCSSATATSPRCSTRFISARALSRFTDRSAARRSIRIRSTTSAAS